jgi:hypothetical protein
MMTPPGAFSRLIQQLDEIFGASRGDVMSQATNALSRAVADVGAIELCQEGVALWRAERAGSSTIGADFSKISLYKSKKYGYNIRLHILASSQTEDDLHNHKWDAASILLCGDLRILNYRIRQDGERASGHVLDRLTYSDEAGQGDGRWVSHGSAEVLMTSEYTLSPGSTDVMGYRELHVIKTVSPRPAVSLVVLGPARRPGAEVFLMSGQSPLDDPDETSLEPEAFLPVIQQALDGVWTRDHRVA